MRLSLVCHADGWWWNSWTHQWCGWLVGEMTRLISLLLRTGQRCPQSVAHCVRQGLRTPTNSATSGRAELRLLVPGTVDKMWASLTWTYFFQLYGSPAMSLTWHCHLNQYIVIITYLIISSKYLWCCPVLVAPSSECSCNMETFPSSFGLI